MLFEQAFTKGAVGRHETFTPRYGWIKKGFDRCLHNPHVFNDEDAIERLGVGKNMVRSIRFWCLFFKVLENSDRPGELKPTGFGKELLDTEKGWDPYLEDPASLWLLHWRIFTPPFLGVSWNLAFSFLALPSFSVRELAEGIRNRAGDFEDFKPIAKSSFVKDASCIIRMYLPDGDGEGGAARCPFTSLALMEPAPGSSNEGCFRFSIAPKKTLPDAIFASALFDFAYNWFPHQKNLALSQIAFAPNSPGIAFRLSETECGRRLEAIARSMKNVEFTDTNGVQQIHFSENPKELSRSCLLKYYGGKVPCSRI